MTKELTSREFTLRRMKKELISMPIRLTQKIVLIGV